MNAYVNALNNPSVGPMAVALLDRIADHYSTANEDTARPAPIDALLMVIATLQEPDPNLVSEDDFFRFSQTIGDKLFELLLGARGYTSVMGITPVENLSRALRGQPMAGS